MIPASSGSFTEMFLGKRIALVHEWIEARAGSEQVFEAIAAVFPDADLFALSVEPNVDLKLNGRSVRTTFLNRPVFRKFRFLALPLMPLAWRMLGKNKYDIVITSHHAFAHCNRLVTKSGIHFVYVHSPARYIWSPEIDARGASFLLTPVRWVMKAVDRRAAKRVNYFAANSTAVAERIFEFWGRQATVIFPPVRTEFFAAPFEDESRSRDFVLGFGRWIPYKRLDQVIRAANLAGLPVKIAGRGPDRAAIVAAAAVATVPVEIIDSPSDEKLRDLYRNAACLVFPTVEDFGIVPVEAQAAGTPVVALSFGGALDTIIHGESGILCDSASAKSLADGIALTRNIRARACRENASRFNGREFLNKFSEWIANSHQQTETLTPTSLVVLSTADWHSPVWTNKQHLSLGLAEHVPVTYVESLGLRRPKLNRVDISRIIRKVSPLSQSVNGNRSEPDHGIELTLTVVTPRVIPFHSFALAQKVNTKLLQRQVRRAVGAPFVLWSFSPITYGLERLASDVVYHSVDLLHEQPGLPAALLLDAELQLLQRNPTVVASSSQIANHLRRQGASDVLLWENVAQVELFEGNGHGTERISRAIFAGNMTPSKLDIAILQQIVAAGIPLALAGPVGIDGNTSNSLNMLIADPRVSYLGNLPLAQLAAEVGRSKVGLIPYILDEHTKGVFPMKTFEYLAAGLPVVSTRLASLADYACKEIVLSDGDQFASRVEDLMSAWTDEVSKACQALARPHSWTSRVNDAVNLLNSINGGARRVE